ncbi:MAG: GNAT family N-acetyltransferase [Micrococcales bacterium]|nr:GNAT family N-acetyltransferase [Micrococcales bacterium]
MIRDTLDMPDGRLRPLLATDAEALARACTDPEIARWTQIPQPYGIEDAHEFLRTRAGEDHVWAIDVTGLDGVIGVRNTRATMPGPVGEIGYWVAPWARGRGVGTAALVAVREELAAAGYQRIDWQALAGNDASVRVATKAGFTIEGHRRQALVQRGRLVDCVVGGWTAPADAPELVAGQWQVQPVAAADVPPDLRPLASSAVAVWVARTAVGGMDSGWVLAVRSVSGLHVVSKDAPPPAIAAARRYLQATGHRLTDDPLPAGWL